MTKDEESCKHFENSETYQQLKKDFLVHENEKTFDEFVKEVQEFIKDRAKERGQNSMTKDEEMLLGDLSQPLKGLEGWEGYEMLKNAMISFKKAINSELARQKK